MQEIIKFELSSRFGIIKKPDSNETYYTYNFPHKIMILGLLGSIIGLNGYNYYSLMKFLGKKVDELPEFYSKLQNLNIGIVPRFKDKNFNKKIQTFNNSVGYASKEIGNNLVVKEQWLEKPCWDIYIFNNNTEEYKKIKDYLINTKCKYIPYIGKNDHFANIKKVEVKSAVKGNFEKVDSIIDEQLIDYVDEFEEMFAFDYKKDKEFQYKEVLPTTLNSRIGYNDFKTFIYTNKKVSIKNFDNIYEIDGKTVYFF